MRNTSGLATRYGSCTAFGRVRVLDIMKFATIIDVETLGNDILSFMSNVGVLNTTPSTVLRNGRGFPRFHFFSGTITVSVKDVG